MQHAKQNRTLGRTRRGRKALLRGLAVSLIEKGKIRTTHAKAKELRPFAERLVTHAKKASVNSRREVATLLGEPKNEILIKLFEEVAKQYADRQGGYTRIIKMGRTTAGRDEAVIEFV